MNKTLLFANKPFHFSLDDLPCLIHGGEGTGASLFTVSVVADLALQGKKLLFLSGYPMARDAFLEQTKQKETFLVETEQQLSQAIALPTIFVGRETPELFLSALRDLPDIDERIIFVKNIELFDQDLFDAVKERQNLILAGDIDACAFGKELQAKQWNSTILFSQPEHDLGFHLPQLERYQGYFYGEGKEGTVALQV